MLLIEKSPYSQNPPFSWHLNSNWKILSASAQILQIFVFLVWMQRFKSQVSTSLSPHTDKGNHPVFIGPGILHKQKLCTSYKTLPLLMSKYHIGTNGVLVKGTDGEETLAKPSQMLIQMQSICICIVKDNGQAQTESTRNYWSNC